MTWGRFLTFEKDPSLVRFLSVRNFLHCGYVSHWGDLHQWRDAPNWEDIPPWKLEYLPNGADFSQCDVISLFCCIHDKYKIIFWNRFITILSLIADLYNKSVLEMSGSKGSILYTTQYSNYTLIHTNHPHTANYITLNTHTLHTTKQYTITHCILLLTRNLFNYTFHTTTCNTL